MHQLAAKESSQTYSDQTTRFFFSKRLVFKTFPANIFVSGKKNYITLAANNFFFLKYVCPGQRFIQTNQ